MSDRAPSFPPLIPRPLAVAPARGMFELGPRARIVVADPSAETTDVGRLLAAALRPATGSALPVVRTARSVEPGYRLRVDDRVAIAARRPAGLFWGTQTLRQLLPPAIESREPVAGPWLVPRGMIHDRPRFAWRGLMLDVARHFFGVEELERLVDQMTLYKLNRLHLHLTDDQGWRLAIRSWPNLTRLGARSAVGEG